jgi:uncharacterized lipoprotein YmbA
MALVATSMVACSLSRESVAKRTFLLEPTPPPMATVQKLTSLRVGLVNVAAPYRGKAFVYRQGELKYERTSTASSSCRPRRCCRR